MSQKSVQRYDTEQVMLEPNSKRSHIRVKTPLDVLINGRSFPAIDWSLGGVGIQEFDLPAEPGDRLQAHLSMPLRGFNVMVTVEMEIVTRNESAKTIGCKFVNLNGEQEELLRYFVNTYIHGELAEIDQVISKNSAMPPALPEIPQRNLSTLVRDIKNLPALMRDTSPEQAAVYLRENWRYGALMSAGVLLIFVTLVSVYSKIFTVDASVAAVSVPMVQMRAPASGMVTAAIAAPKAVVAKGQELFTVKNDALVGEFEVAKANLQALEAKIVSFKKQLEGQDAFVKEYGSLSESELSRAQATLRRAQRSMETATRQFERAQILKEKGLMTEASFDNQRDMFDKAEQQLSAAQATLAEAQSNRRMVGKGYYFTGSRVEGKDGMDLKHALTMAESERSVLTARIDALQKQISELRVVSPCDCIVEEINAQNNSWITGGTLAYVLIEQKPENYSIEALIPQDEVHKITVGNNADIRLANGGDVIRGKVSAINVANLGQKRFGLADFAEKNPVYAKVMITPDHKLARVEAGLPAQVKVYLDTAAVFF
ncbi:MAG: HlyD family efflux transporter periplasmic adaptor subunit [Alphaproteobacteria bacterium]|nr:HlyD family efflux transporter periplasmic adaptor subunit [Alphaproteobacteria bacterium]